MRDANTPRSDKGAKSKIEKMIEEALHYLLHLLKND